MKATMRAFFCLVPLAVWSYAADDRLSMAASMVVMVLLLPLWVLDRTVGDDG